MGCRVKDSMRGMKNDSAVLRVPGKKIPGQKPTSIRKGKEHKWFPLCLWAYAGARSGRHTFDNGDYIHSL